MAKRSLTKRQSDILEYISYRIKNENLPPTIQEIGNEFGMKSTNAVADVLKVLEKKGYINRHQKGKSRGISLNETDEKKEHILEDDSVSQLSIIGNGDLENPISVFLNPIGNIKLDREFFDIENKSHFAVYVGDNGLSKEGIFLGDLAIVSQGRTIESGKVVAVLLKDKVVLRVLEKFSDGDELTASTRGYSMIKLRKHKKPAVVLGLVKSIIKKMD